MAGLTLADLRLSSKRRSDMENSDFITDSEWNEYVNEAGSELHDLILVADPRSIIIRYSLFTSTNQQFYDLPDDFYKLEAVYRKIGDARYGVDRTNFHGIGNGSAVLSSVIIGGAPYQYALVGNQIYFLPIPNGQNEVELWYYPSYTRLTLDTDTIDYPVVNGWEEFIVIASVIKAKEKERSDMSAELRAKAELKGRIIEMANKRDEWEPPRFIDIYGATSRNRRYNSYNPYANLPYRWFR